MTCMYREKEVKMKMAQEQWLQLKMKLDCDITWKLIFSEGNATLVGGKHVLCEGV